MIIYVTWFDAASEHKETIAPSDATGFSSLYEAWQFFGLPCAIKETRRMIICDGGLAISDFKFN